MGLFKKHLFLVKAINFVKMFEKLLAFKLSKAIINDFI